MGRKAAVLTSAAASLLAAAGRAAAQCAMCRTALVSSEEGRALAAAFNDGILFLFAAPFAVILAVGVVVFVTVRRKAQREAAVGFSSSRRARSTMAATSARSSFAS